MCGERLKNKRKEQVFGYLLVLSHPTRVKVRLDWSKPSFFQYEKILVQEPGQRKEGVDFTTFRRRTIKRVRKS